MNNNNFEQENSRIKEILTPKHTPECKIKFAAVKQKKSPRRLLYIRIASAAAILAVALVVFTHTDFVEKSHAAGITMEMIERAIEKIANKNSLYLELQSYDEYENRNIDGRLYLLKKDSTTYIREEWDDRKSTVAIYGKDSMQLWENGKLKAETEVPFRHEDYESFFDKMDNLLTKIGETGYILNEQKESPTHEQNKNLDRLLFYSTPMGTIESIKVLKEEQTIIFETKPAAEHSPFYALEFSAKKEAFTNIKIVMDVEEDGSTSQRIVLMDINKIAFDYPITLDDIMRKPE